MMTDSPWHSEVNMKIVPTLLLVLFTAPLQSKDFDIADRAEFNKLFPKDAAVQKLAGGLQFVEGPVWIEEKGGYLVFSDIPADEMKRWDPAGGVKTFRKPSGNANGNTLDREGRLLTAEHAGRVSRTEKNGTVVTVADAFQGRKLSSPNDAVVRSDGTIWFTDPDYGLGARQRETPGNYVYRYDPAAASLTAVIKNLDKPNGLCFSPDEQRLYVADSGQPHDIHAYSVRTDGSLGEARLFATVDKGVPDGIRCDEGGRVWSSSGDGVQIFSPKGALIARILLPESAANLAFGGPKGTTLYITARTSVYGIETSVRQARRPSGAR